jgi:hypothetical protein
MAGVTAIQGVDDTLKKLTSDAVAALSPKPDVTVGPLDRDVEELRLNWFLYRIAPNPAYRNMEPPRTGWRTARGRPPLALQLEYLLTAFPASTTNGGDQEQFAHAALAAAMQALHANAIVGESDPALSPLAKPLVEPLRITLDTLDLESISKLWTAVSKPLRLSVGYEVSLVVVDSAEQHVAGPPALEPRVALAPSLGPRPLSADPELVGYGQDLVVTVAGLTAGTVFTLARSLGDPPGVGDWPLAGVPGPAPGTVTLALPYPGLAPGCRRLGATALELGLPAGGGTVDITIVPRVAAPLAPLTRGSSAALDVVHAAADIEVFLNGARVPPADVAFDSPTRIAITVPGSTPTGPGHIELRAAKVAGPVTPVVVA